MKTFFSKEQLLRYKFGFCIFAVGILYFLVSFCIGLGALNFIGAVLTAAVSLLAVLWLIIKKTLHPYLTAASGAMLFLSVLFLMIWGSDAAGKFVYGIVLALPAFACFILMVAGVKKAFPRPLIYTTAVLMVGFMVVYILFMDLRYRPTVPSLQKGHDEYLARVRGTVGNPDAPNVLFIIMDDMGYADISRYTYKEDADTAIIQTPNIDSIADMGAMFENFYASSPVCSPSRFGVMTGRYALRGYQDNVVFPSDQSLSPFNYFRYVNTFEFQRNVQGMLGDEITVAEALGAAGYKTGAFGKWHMGDTGEYLPNNQGFDYFYGTLHVNDVPNYEFYRNTAGKLEKTVKNKDMDQRKTTEILNGEVMNFITDAVDNGEKFFAYYGSPWPHAPLNAGEDWLGTSDAGTYGDCIEEFDAGVGDIISLLKEKGVFEDTLIVFTSDNGPGKEGAAGAHRGRKGTTFDGGQKVPLLVAYEKGGIAAGSVITAHAMNIDFFPTLLSFAGVDILPTDRVIDGVSLKPLLTGQIAPDAVVHDVLYHIRRGSPQAVQMPVTQDGVVTHYKFYDSVQNENSAFFNQTYKNYMFNLSLDPAEAYNITPNNPALAATLSEQLTAFQKEIKENRRGIL